MRIIAGKYRSLNLKMVGTELTRETSDKVRGAVLNSIGSEVIGSVVLDLFAGSGSYGLECLSRGASKAYFVDKQKAAIDVINENVKHLKVEEQSRVVLSQYQKALDIFANENIRFDIIILDPPYDFNAYETLLESLVDLLSDSGMIVCEVHKNFNLDIELIKNLEIFKEKVYGIKKIIYLNK